VTRAAALCAAAAAVVYSVRAHAQVELQTRLSAPVVEQNQPFQLQLRATLEGASSPPQNPRLQVPAGIALQGPSLAPETRVTIVNGRMMQSSGVTATWVLVASRPGRYRIGPPSIEIAGKIARGEAKTVEVVAPGTLPQGPGGIPGRAPFDPFGFFDPFRGFPRFPFPFDDPQAAEPQQPTYPPELAVESAPDPIAFVIGKARPQRVVVGQAVQFGAYAYGGRGRFGIETATEPSRAGFVAHYDKEPATAYEVPIGDRVFIGVRAYSLVLFPIQAGTLRIGSMRLGFSGRNYAGATPGQLLVRESPPIDVEVVEPPMRGRPPGYRVGDVGQYTLTASVDPPKVRQGEAVSVVAKLEGTGNVPTKLNVPLQTDVEWQEPTSTESFEVTDGTVRGQRVFTFVVKLDRAGKIDLGELTLPFYDPERKRYSIARAALGSVEVTPTANPSRAAAAGSAPTAEKHDRLHGVLPPPPGLRALPARKRPLTDRPYFWTLLALGPLGVLVASGLVHAGGKLSARLRARRETPAEHASREVSIAREAHARGDSGATAAAVERAVHFAIEGATGLKSRGVLRSELARELQRRGFSQELATRAVALLEQTESARFVGPEATSTSNLAADAGEFVRSALRVRQS